jgi:uncharacterized protein DUF6496
MPSKATVKKAKHELRAGKSPTTAAGAFVHEEIEHVRKGKHGVRSTKQAIAIGLSKARRAGVPLKPPGRGRTSARTRRSAARDYATGQGRRRPRAPSPRRSRANLRRLQRYGKEPVSRDALSRQAKRASQSRSKRSR